MIAAMTLRFLDPFGTGKLVLFQVTYDKVCSFTFLRLNSRLKILPRTGMLMSSYSSWFLAYLG